MNGLQVILIVKELENVGFRLRLGWRETRDRDRQKGEGI
jgi:hypothetical protein